MELRCLGMKKRMLLRVARAAHEPKVNQTNIARKAGMGIFRYWQIENGEGLPPSADEKNAVAAALSLRVSDIEWPNVKVTHRVERTA